MKAKEMGKEKSNKFQYPFKVGYYEHPQPMHRRRETVAHLVENGQSKGLCGREVMYYENSYENDVLRFDWNVENRIAFAAQMPKHYSPVCKKCANIFKWRPTLKQKSTLKPKPKQLPESDLFSNV